MAGEVLRGALGFLRIDVELRADGEVFFVGKDELLEVDNMLCS